MQSNHEIAEAGSAAFRAGKNIKDNPYERGTVESVCWVAGWTTAFYFQSGKAGRGLPK